MYEILTKLLNIPYYEVVHAEITQETIELEIQSTLKYIPCPSCQESCSSIHENHPRRIRDLPISGKACYLRFVRRRFFCQRCQKPFSEPLDFVDLRRDYTKRYQAMIFNMVRENNILSVHRLEQLSFDQIESIFLDEAKKRIPQNPYKHLKRLGVDEIALRKGKGNYVLILSNLDTGHVIDVLQNRTKETLKSSLIRIPEAIRSEVSEVCIDMWQPYDDVCSDCFAKAKIVIDRFHVMQALNVELKELKNQIKKQQPQTLEGCEGCHYALLKNADDLTDEQSQTLANVYEASPILKKAHRLKECFRHIFESSKNPKSAQRRLQQWMQIAKHHAYFPEFLKTLNNWFPKILHYFNNRTTNGMVEGINNKIKLIKRRAYGFRNFEHFRLRVIAAFI